MIILPPEVCDALSRMAFCCLQKIRSSKFAVLCLRLSNLSVSKKLIWRMCLIAAGRL